MQTPAPEFSFPVEIAQLPPGGATYDIAAPADALVRIAARLDIVAVEKLEATLTLKPMGGGVVRVSGPLAAAVVQSCVVSLAPVPAAIDEAIDIRFVANDPSEGRYTAEDVEPEGEEPPEVAHGGRIDLGELAVAQLALVLDPYPRAPGVSFDARKWGGPAPERASPFAALADLKKKKQS